MKRGAAVVSSLLVSFLMSAVGREVMGWRRDIGGVE